MHRVDRSSTLAQVVQALRTLRWGSRPKEEGLVCAYEKGGFADSEACGRVIAPINLRIPSSHELWPARGRARAEALVRLGWRLSSTDRSPGPFGNEAQSIMDAWRGLVMVHALVRADFELG